VEKKQHTLAAQQRPWFQRIHAAGKFKDGEDLVRVHVLDAEQRSTCRGVHRRSNLLTTITIVERRRGCSDVRTEDAGNCEIMNRASYAASLWLGKDAKAPNSRCGFVASQKPLAPDFGIGYHPVRKETTMKLLRLLALLVIGFSASAFAQCAAFPCVVASLALTNQSQAIPATAIFTPTANGVFRISSYISTSTGTNKNATWEAFEGWTDEIGPRQGGFVF